MQTRSNKVLRGNGTHGFKFEEAWLLWDDYKKAVEEAWIAQGRLDSAMAAVQGKIKECGVGLSAQGFSKTYLDIEEIKNLQKQVDKMNCGELTEENKVEFLEVSKRLDDLLLKQEIFWHQRSRVSLLKHGEKDTKFFHSKASQRRRRNFIQGIRDQQQVWVEEINDITRVATNYFESMFSTNGCVKMEECLNTVPYRVTLDMLDVLSNEYSVEEIKATFFQMGPTKALGPDGMNALFYQKFWHICG